MSYLHQKIWSIILLLLIASASLVTTRSATAQTTIDGRFGEYWQEHGGLPIFGLPLGPQTLDYNSDTRRQHLTQWFERNRFELHEANRRPYDVLLGRLGVDRLQQLGRTWQSLPKAAPNAPHYFAETGHAIAHGPFWSYWSSNGLEFDGRPGKSYQESLALFGLPLSEPAIETNTSGDRVLTQWFERARFEDHGTRGVLLGLLGNEVRNATTPPPPVTRLKYFWPRTSPLSVWHQGSYADERSFVLHLAWPHATEPDTTISGGAIAPPPEGRGTEVIVRGQRGTLHTLGAKLALSWTEEGQFYMIYSSLRQNELLALANDLETLDLQTFRARLKPPQEPAGRLKYFWPRQYPLTVWYGGGSYADERGFALHLAWPHSREPDATVSGGAAAVPPDGRGQSVTVRGQQGTLYATGTRSTLVWLEDGQRYMIHSNLPVSDMVMLTDDLEALDLHTFRARLRPAQQPSGRLRYFWPRTSPLSVWHQGSYADERSFVLHLAWPHATEPDTTISGGAIAPPPEGRGTEVIVRGQRGTLHTLGAKLALSWTEEGQFYMIYSSLRQNELLALANDLETLDLQTFRARLAQR